MVMSVLTPLSKMNEIHYWENKPFSTIWPQQESKPNLRTSGVKRTIKKKPKRVRTAFTTEQLRILEQSFKEAKYINAITRKELANRLKMNDKVIKIWFQNRRMKEKRDSESSFDSASELNATSPESSQSENVCTPVTVEHKFEIGEPQYQLPNYNLPEYQQQSLCNDTMSFEYDTNAYATQYYPNENQCGFFNGYGYNFAPYYNSNMNDYWQCNNFGQSNEYF